MQTKIGTLFLLAAVSLATLSFTPDPSILKEGDLIFHGSNSKQSRALILALDSPYTHVGVIFKRHGRWQVLEAVQPVRYTSLRNFIRRGTRNHYVIKRLKNADAALTPAVIADMKKIGAGFLGRSYDLQFMWSDRKIYCSELVWKLYKRAADIEIGGLVPIRSFDLSHPFVKKKLHQRYGNRVPLDEPVIPPSTMFASEKLELVVEYP